MSEKVLHVTSVSWKLDKSKPPILTIDALGDVGSSGWTDGKLVIKEYIVEPADGFQEFDFEATGPGPGPTTRPILPINGSYELTDPAPWIKGVRVHAAKNSLEILFENGSSVGGPA